jgi:hypothetical protein
MKRVGRDPPVAPFCDQGAPSLRAGVISLYSPEGGEGRGEEAFEVTDIRSIAGRMGRSSRATLPNPLPARASRGEGDEARAGPWKLSEQITTGKTGHRFVVVALSYFEHRWRKHRGEQGLWFDERRLLPE